MLTSLSISAQWIGGSSGLFSSAAGRSAFPSLASLTLVFEWYASLVRFIRTGWHDHDHSNVSDGDSTKNNDNINDRNHDNNVSNNDINCDHHGNDESSRVGKSDNLQRATTDHRRKMTNDVDTRGAGKRIIPPSVSSLVLKVTLACSPHPRSCTLDIALARSSGSCEQRARLRLLPKPMARVGVCAQVRS